jgi:hypothetical protein
VNRIRVIGHRIALLTGLATAMLAAVGAVPAFAQPLPPPDGICGSCAPTAGGMPWWQVALIAVGVLAAVAVVVAMLIRRVRAGRRQVATPPRQVVHGK